MTSPIDRVKSLISRGQFQEALSRCNEELRKDPGNLELVVEKAMLLGSPMPEVSDPEAALSMLKEAIQEHPCQPLLHRTLAAVYETGLGDYQSAEREYRTALECGDTTSSTYMALAMLRDYPGVSIKVDEAIGHLRKAAETAPSDWQVRRELALLLWRMGEATEAENQLGKALTCTPGPEEFSRKQIERWIAQLREGVSFAVGFLQSKRK